MRQLAGAAIVKRELVGREPQSFAHGEVLRAKAHNIGSNQFWHYFPLRSHRLLRALVFHARQLQPLDAGDFRALN